jgi:hypothetical protein
MGCQGFLCAISSMTTIDVCKLGSEFGWLVHHN